MNYWRFSLFQELACSHIRRIPSQGIMVRITSWQAQYRIEKKVNILTQNFWTFFHENFLEVWWGPGELAAPRVGRVAISFLYLFFISFIFIPYSYTYLLFNLYLFKFSYLCIIKLIFISIFYTFLFNFS